ncbi:hypothetical protein [Streptomyces sediminimaris]|uniref:hypothetical protein n=1 Tax=Streptomyces sediminimaris TaxID=3383721 RepID=UPI003999BF98
MRASRARRLRRRTGRRAPAEVPGLVLTDYTPGDSAWADGLREQLITADMPRCKDLEDRDGLGYVYAGEGYARCLPCRDPGYG